MAERRPLVLINERIRELPDGDTLGPVNTSRDLIYTDGVLTEVNIYSDIGKTILVEHRELIYVDGKLTTINFYNGALVLIKTRELTYSSGNLTSVVDE